MKLRILVWIVILATPTTLWFLFTEDGRDAFQLIYADTSSHQGNIQTIEIPVPGSPVLIPVNPVPKHAAIMVLINPAVAGAVLIDNKNHKAGFNTFTEEKFTEIPNSSVQQKNNSLLVKIEPSTDTQYQLHITSKEQSNFNLSVRGTSPSGETLTQMSTPWIQSNRLVIYDIDLNKVQRLTFNTTSTKPVKKEDFIRLREERVAIVKKESLDEICNKVNAILSSAAGDKFKRYDGEFSFNNENYNGCRFSFSETAEPEQRIEIPSEFYLDSKTQLAKDGWRQDLDLAAGGPDGSLLVIRKQHQFCVLSEQHDGGVDDDPSYIPSNDYSIDIECSEEAGI